MKCYFEIAGKWIRGNVVSMSGGSEINFSSRNDKGFTDHLTLSSPEIMFHGSGMVVTGYQRQESVAPPNTYRLMSVEIKCEKPGE